jgi:hypothetical protein
MTNTHPREDVTGDATGGVIPYKNVPALVAYYLGVFSLIPCFAIPLGVAALILGVVGLATYKKHPQVRGAVHAWVGIVLGGLMLLANLAVIVFMFVVAAAG